MATQPCPGICEVRLKYTADEQPIENVYHVKKNTLSHWTNLELTALGDVIEAWHAGNMVPILPVGLILAEIILTDLTDLAGLKKVISVTGEGEGTNPSPMLPLNVTKAMGLFIGSRGRGVNGHMYWPALAENQVTGDQVVTTTLTAMQLALEQLVTTVFETLPGQTLVVLSRYFQGGKRAIGVGEAINAIDTPNSYTSTQKDRLPGHKRRRKARTTP